MLRKITLAALLAGAATLPALAQGAACTAPAVPAMADPAKGTVDQMRAMLTSAQGFITASDTYQTCLGQDIANQKAAATPDKPFDPAIEKADMDKASANQAMKEKVGADATAVLNSFKKAHNCDGKPLASCS